MFRINSAELSSQQVEIKELLDHIEDLGIFGNPTVEPVEYPTERNRMFLGTEGVKEMIEKGVYYPEMEQGIIGTTGVEATITAYRYWRGVRASGNYPILPIQACVGINFIENFGGNGIQSINLDPLSLTATGFSRGCALLERSERSQQVPLSHEESMSVVSGMLDSLTAELH